MAKLKINYPKDKLQQNSTLWKYGMVVLTIILICIFLPKQPRFQYEYEKGKPWNHENLTSPYNFAILKTPEELARDKQYILRTVQPIYNLNDVASKEQIDQFNTDLNEKWQSSQLDSTGTDITKYREVGTALLSYIYERGIISLNNRFQIKGNDSVKNDATAMEYNFVLVHDNVAQQKNTADCYTIESANKYLKETLEKNNLIEHKAWFAEVLKSYVTINYVFNESQTNKVEQNALANISTTRGMVQKDELIAEQGKIINNESYQKLESLRKVFEDESRISGEQNLVMFGHFLLISLAMSLLMVFLYYFRRDIFNNNRLLFIIFIVILVMLGVLSWAIKMKIPSLYYIPYCSVPIIFRLLFDTRIALNIHILMVLVAGLFVPNSFDFVFLQFTSGMVAIYSIKTLVKREQFLVSSVVILATYILAYIGLVLTRNGSFTTIYWQDILPFAVSVGLTLLAYPLIYAFEKLFGIVSDLTLMELTNSNSRLLRELSLKAPGTFQHSLQVANLAEAAIYKIGGNPLLVRAGALYHDIGKMINPLYFIENQKTNDNPHEELTAEQSAQIIISHVLKGIEMARKHQMPEVVIDFIRTHHGTTKVDYFYNLAVKDNPDKVIDESIFRYPGPVPFSKETAVLMMADSVEASSRALKEPTEESINTLVDKIIDHKLMQRQFANADITMRDITEVSKIFKAMLKSIYHVRIDYDLSKKKDN
ncbi:HDIG domain-containing protein [Sphingobacterium sp. DK4209]|uniref:HDIG domain-containing protein n=1 Tax=Sphingobacterium zhuxiongii TaxID=2662364 RepID=A0A5Q0QBC7_9SPHI|nr:MULTISPECIES: HDIG domain-containing metalloprotein [unclassified Sphingobacterium]MVZ66602.1 HDIG domain-containing protein [Sphingobacterium sp. DK4209]QGA26786.1 HDIG domain-containing protein [Sphingobacterium sp. dk4302]